MNKAPTTEEKPQKESRNSKTEKLEKPRKSKGLVCDKCGKKYKREAHYAKHIKKCPGKKVNGGARPGAGRKAGVRDPDIVEREQKVGARKVSMSERKLDMQEAIAAKTNQLIAHQIHIALSNSRLYVRVKREDTVPTASDSKKKGKKVQVRYDVYRVTDEDEFMRYLMLPHDPTTGAAKDEETGHEYFYMLGKGSNYYALTNLLDRAYGRPKESVELGEDPEQPLTPIEGGTAALAKSFRDHIMEVTKSSHNAEVKSGQ